MNKVIVVIKGGMVQDVYATEDIELQVFDMDLYDDDSGFIGKTTLEEKVKGYKTIIN